MFCKNNFLRPDVFTYFLFICSGGSSSTGIGHGSLPRPSSPSRRGMPGHNSGAPLGSRHQQTGRGTGFNRNAENSDWRFNREGSHEEYASSSYQHQQQQTSQSYDRWGNDFRTGNTNVQIVFGARTKLRVTVWIWIPYIRSTNFLVSFLSFCTEPQE